MNDRWSEKSGRKKVPMANAYHSHCGRGFQVALGQKGMDMNNKNNSLFARTIFALFLAVQVWVWLRYAGAFWLSDSFSERGRSAATPV